MADAPDLPPTPEEARAAEALREALDRGAPGEGADLLRSLAAAHSPRALDARENEALVARALARGRAQPRGVVVRVVFGVAAVAAMAAGVVLVFERAGTAPAPTAKAELARVRSTQPLFDRPFERAETSARVDRIAMARASDLRENRFAKWGVR